MIYDTLDAAEAAVERLHEFAVEEGLGSQSSLKSSRIPEGFTGFKPDCLIPTIDEGWTPATRPNSRSVLLELMSG